MRIQIHSPGIRNDLFRIRLRNYRDPDPTHCLWAYLKIILEKKTPYTGYGTGNQFKKRIYKISTVLLLPSTGILYFLFDTTVLQPRIFRPKN